MGKTGLLLMTDAIMDQIRQHRTFGGDHSRLLQARWRGENKGVGLGRAKSHKCYRPPKRE